MQRIGPALPRGPVQSGTGVHRNTSVPIRVHRTGGPRTITSINLAYNQRCRCTTIASEPSKSTDGASVPSKSTESASVQLDGNGSASVQMGWLWRHQVRRDRDRARDRLQRAQVVARQSAAARLCAAAVLQRAQVIA